MDERIEKYFKGELSSIERVQFLQEVDSNEILKKAICGISEFVCTVEFESTDREPAAR